MKELYSFTVDKEDMVEEVTIEKNEAGEEITTTKKVKGKVPFRFVIQKPSRTSIDTGDLFYSVAVSQGIKAGLLTRAQLAAKFADEQELTSEKDKARYSKLFVELYDKQTELQKLIINKETLTEAETKTKEELVAKIASISKELQELESLQSSIFDHTAEIKARNKTIIWWVFELAHKDTDKGPVKIFNKPTYAENIKEYDVIEEQEDKVLIEATRKLMFLISVWYVGKASTKAEFDEVLKILETQEVS